MRNKPEEVKIQVEKLKIEFKKFENFVSEINEEVDMSLVELVVEWLQELVLQLWSLQLWLLQQHFTASTGTAISTLVLQQQCSTSMVRGGALAAGGGGTAAGSHC